ncbi:hypothetical protein SAMN04488136_11045 [Vibrio xiamenensis]|uniref:Uncharacterized protein n=1 Tax=Vibrio xiamenensis TaxID=861298 RepID=A0A1G8ACB6_9VIBR|nr:hypothetical protein [Vibrio xiamenensis]SDH18588.1 hypothetical protein SAMN04488136_11045 [Vibrio xiamenensis]
MAVVPKHGQNHNKYDPSQDLTADQIHRFGKVANKVQKQKEQQEERPSAMVSARRAALRPIIRPKPDKPNTARYAIWLMVVLVVCLWIMYMSG